MTHNSSRKKKETMTHNISKTLGHQILLGLTKTHPCVEHTYILVLVENFSLDLGILVIHSSCKL